MLKICYRFTKCGEEQIAMVKPKKNPKRVVAGKKLAAYNAVEKERHAK